MAAEAEAAREARAKIIRSSGEEKAIRTLRQAADELVSPRALQLRYLQVITHFWGVTTEGDWMVWCDPKVVGFWEFSFPAFAFSLQSTYFVSLDPQYNW